MSSSPPPSYRALLAVPGLSRLLSSALLSRTAAQMSSLVLVLFVLDRFHSPQLSGITVLASIAPGLLLSPIAGAVLDRSARVPLIVLDYVVAGAALLLIAVLATAGVLAPWSLLLIAALQSTTMPLSNSGTRSLLPMIVPRAMWDRANAVDSGGYVVATVVGPGLGGAIVALVGATWALAVPAALSFAAGALILPMRLPVTATAATGSILRDARDGLLYVVRNRGLRALAVTVSVFNIAGGVLTVGLPVLVFSRLHGTSVEVGLLFAVMGGSGIVAGLATGRIDSEGRERAMLITGCVVTAVAMLVLVVAHSMAAAVAAMALVGIANGPLDIALFSLRQRVTDPAWFGRAFAVSMSLNFSGIPLGSAVTGPIVARSVSAAFLMAMVFACLAVLGPLLMLPSPRRAAATATASKPETAAASKPAHPR
jgi:MFS family permease